MKKVIFLSVALSIVFALLLIQDEIVIAASPEKPCADTDLNCWVNLLQSKNLREKEMAVGHLDFLYSRHQMEAAKDALINLVEKESNKIQPDGGFKPENPEAGEGEFEFFYHLCKRVGEYRDPKAIPLLLRIGEIVALEPYGEMVLDIIIAKLEDKNPGQRAAAAYVLTNFLKPKEKGYIADGEARNKIHSALLKATKDKESFVRQQVVIALGNFQDDEVIATLEDIKNNDPYYLIGKNVKTGERGIKRYTVRDKAQEALEKIKKAKGQ